MGSSVRPGVDEAAWCLHEIRRPIAAVQAYAEILADEISGALNPEQKDYVETILSNAVRLEEQAVTLYEFMEVVCGDVRLRREAIDLEALCREAVDSVSAKWKARGVELRFESRCAGVAVEADSARLRRTMVRLLARAIEQGIGRSEGEVVVRLATETQNAALIAVTVAAPEGSASGECVREVHGHRGESGELDPEWEVCRAVAAQHGGRLQVETGESGKPEFKLRLPRREV